MTTQSQERGSSTAVLLAAWLAVGLPLLWGVAQTLVKAAQLFK